MNMKLGYIILLFFISFTSISQNINIVGNVVDSNTQKPIAFASIKVKGTQKGVVTDIDGNFTLSNIALPYHLLINHIGYAQTDIIVKNGNDILTISLTRNSELLNEVIVSSNLNPAHRIIELLQKNKIKNDPLKIPAFFYNAYTISSIGVSPLFNTMIKEESEKNKQQIIISNNKKKENLRIMTEKDSIMLKARKDSSHLVLDHYIFMTESYTERKYLYPIKSKETILATKITGIKNPLFAVSEDDLNQFGFYSDYINMLNKTYTSPLIDGSIKLYKFKLNEVIPHEKDTTWVISYMPKTNKNFNGLKGILYINSNKYAIENVDASPADEKDMFLTFRLQQKYEYINGRWFPKQLNSYIAQKLVIKDSVLLFFNKRINLTNIDFNKNYKNVDFSDITQEFVENAGNRSEKEWDNMRADSLGDKEKATYNAYDLLPADVTKRLNGINKFREIYALQAIPWGKVDVPFNTILSGANSYEKLRLGFGVQSNPLLSKFIKIGGSLGYGFGDNAFKYGGNTNFILNKRNQTEIKFSYKQDLSEPGTIPYFTENTTLYVNNIIRNIFSYRFDSVRQFKIHFNTKINRNLKSDLWLFNEKRSAAEYDYKFDINQNNQFKHEYNITEAGIGIRYTSRESYKQIGRAIVLKTPPKSRIFLQIGHGFKDILGGEVDYTKVALQINQVFNLKSLGRTTYTFEAGKIWGNIPYGYMFNTKGIIRSEGSKTGIYIGNSFQTVGVYEFNATQSASLFVHQNFGNLLFKPKNVNVRPEFILVQNIGYGTLENKSLHQGISLNAPEKGIFETGLIINNIYRVKTPFFYLGFGVGYFRRYGYYKLPEASRNYTVNFGLTISQ